MVTQSDCPYVPRARLRPGLLGAQDRAAGMDSGVYHQETMVLHESRQCEEQRLEHLLQETY